MDEIVPNYFVESEYIAMYSDIADAVRDGSWKSGADHYIAHGRSEGRQAYRMDEVWYLRSYPMARKEIEDGLVMSPQEHFERYGCNRGYLPHPGSPRPDNPAATPSRFGGLWVDQPNARDIVAGRLEIGLITEEQARQLLFFIENGYTVIEKAIPDHELEPALEELERAYSGQNPQQMFECRSLAKDHSPFQSEMLGQPSKALDIHWFSDAIRDVIFTDRIRQFLELLFDSRALASQSLGFYRGSAQEAHQDSAFVPYTLQRGFAASWIALEDVEAGAGELFYYVGSHRLGDWLYDRKYKSVSEAVRGGVGKTAADEMVTAHVGSLPPRAAAAHLQERTLLAKRGDVLIWHADLAHGGKPISISRTRKSIVSHYCGKYSAPLYAERMATPLHEHRGRGLYTTSHYPSLPPSAGRIRPPETTPASSTPTAAPASSPTSLAAAKERMAEPAARAPQPERSAGTAAPRRAGAANR
jgi:ectoine hydroxylase-related dioxygenase (phytanoyl-CoA dioxygenase family)